MDWVWQPLTEAAAIQLSAISLAAPTPTAITLSAVTPSLSMSLGAPTPTQLVLAGVASSLSSSLSAPAPSALTLSGIASSLSASLVSPTPSALILAGIAPSASRSLAAPSPTAIVLTTTIPTLGISIVTAAPASLTLSPGFAVLSTSLAATPGALTLLSIPPSLGRGLSAAVTALVLDSLLASLDIVVPLPSSFTEVFAAVSSADIRPSITDFSPVCDVKSVTNQKYAPISRMTPITHHSASLAISPSPSALVSDSTGISTDSGNQVTVEVS